MRLIWLECLGYHRLCCGDLDGVVIWYKVGGCELLYVTLSMGVWFGCLFCVFWLMMVVMIFATCAY